jgi:hypothetical protein
MMSTVLKYTLLMIKSFTFGSNHIYTCDGILSNGGGGAGSAPCAGSA